MRYIPASDAVVERLRKQAKKLQRTGGGKHTDLLNKVAKAEGYDHWHHVVQCNENAKAATQMRSIREECEAIIAAEQRGVVKIVMTQAGVACPPFVLFSTGIGDAWLLEPDEQLAMCLVWQGAREEIGISDDPSRIEVAWDGSYELLGDFFRLETNNPKIGDRAIGGYPLGEVRKMLDQAQSTMTKMAAVIGQVYAVEITAEVVAQMVKKGWSENEVLKMKADGFHYSPGRDSLISPIFSSDDEDFDEQSDEDPPQAVRS